VDKEILSFNAWDSNAFSATFSSLCQYENMATTCEVKFCKYLLGVNKRSTNIAVLSELGRMPLYNDFWQKLPQI
jgi:hypothetical protein